MLFSKLLSIYIPLIGWTGAGYLLGRVLPKSAPTQIGKFLFWIGVPLGILAFLRHAQLSGALWIAPVSAWAAIALGYGLAEVGWRWQNRKEAGRGAEKAGTAGKFEGDDRRFNRLNAGTNPPRKASFLLAAMVGNTGYIGFPISLALVGAEHFVWAVFYDMVGSTPGSYGLGVAIAARSSHQTVPWQAAIQAMLLNPALWSFGIGLWTRDFPLPTWAEASLQQFAWAIVSLSLVLVGMRLSQLSTLRHVQPALISLSIKMLLVPFLLGTVLKLTGLTDSVHRAIVLQMAMPPAFATLVLAEAYGLDPEFAVTAIAIGSISLLFTLPLWLWVF
jgi:malate permease and related proteins